MNLSNVHRRARGHPRILLTLRNRTRTLQSDSDRDESGIFDPAKLRLSQNFTEDVGVKKILITIPVRKPGKQVFFRAHATRLSVDYRDSR